MILGLAESRPSHNRASHLEKRNAVSAAAGPLFFSAPRVCSVTACRTALVGELAMGGWTPALVCASLALFIAAGVCEVGGGWLVWQSLREVSARREPSLNKLADKRFR